MRQSADNLVRERPTKSLGTAVVLALFLGPFGLLYASLLGGAVMLAVSVIILVPLLMGLHINAVLFFPDWVICIAWATFSAWPDTGETGTRADLPARPGAGADGAPDRS